MDLYKLVPTFDKRSGRPSKPEVQVCGWICDFCGHAWTEDEDDYSPNIYRISEESGALPIRRRALHELGGSGVPEVQESERMILSP